LRRSCPGGRRQLDQALERAVGALRHPVAALIFLALLLLLAGNPQHPVLERHIDIFRIDPRPIRSTA